MTQTAWNSVHYQSADGLTLHARDYASDAGGTPVVCLPGLSRNARDFDCLATYLANHPVNPRRVLCFDYRGRGASDYAPDWRTYNPVQELDDLILGLNFLEIDRAILVGTSRGGLIAMLAAARVGDRMAGAVLNDIGPQVDMDGMLRIKAYLGKAKPVETWDQALAATRAMAESQFPGLDHAEWQTMTRQLFKAENGRPVVDYDRNLLRTLDILSADTPLPAMWEVFAAMAQMPVLVIRGALSDILRPETVSRMAEIHPGLRTVVVADQGHAPLLWDVPTNEAIASFVAEIP